jgi:hypothetical protein
VQNDPIYAHNLAGRRPIMALVLLVAAVMIALGMQHDAPWFFLAPAVLAVLMALWAVISNPQTGIKLTKTTLHYYNRDHKRDIAVAHIRSVKIDSDIDGGPSADLVLASGEKVHIPAMCMNRDLGPALESLGIKVVGN